MIYELDYYQKEAVCCKSKNTLVVAAPGSGKTTVIVNRLIYLTEKNKISPDNIAVITFTKMASENMKNRFIEVSHSYKLPFFGTMHSLFYRILKQCYGNIEIISEREAFDLIRNILHSYLENISEEKVKEVLNNISLYKNSSQFKATFDNNAFQKCLDCYEEYKKNNNLMDFDDLQLYCRELLIKDMSILTKYRNVYKYILVDEFQDTDEIQIQILQMLNYNNSIFAVGDEDQSIYGFRGAKTQYMLNFDKMFNDSEVFFLSINYRSPRNIVDISRRIISNNVGRNNKEINSKKIYSEEISIIASENEEDEAEKISKVLLEINVMGKNVLDNTAILYRTNRESKSLIDIFIRDNIKFYFLDGEYNFFEHFICKDLIAYLKLSLNYFDRESFIRILNKPNRFISKLSIEKLKREKMRKEVFETFCDYDMVSFNQISEVKAIEKSIKRLAKYSVEDGVKYICHKLGYKKYIESYSKKQGVDIEAFNKIINDFAKYGKSYKKVEDYIEHIQRIKTTISSNNIKKEGVRLSTIHGVKGMEFRNVFIINCNEGSIPYYKDDQCNIEEERRLFYVAMTRTIEKLYICYNKTINGSDKEPSVFLREGKLLEI